MRSDDGDGVETGGDISTREVREGLHRLAAVLVADTEAATALTAQTLAAAQPGASEDDLRTDLVQAYLRATPRRAERVPVGDTQDPGEVLRTLAPKARAATALRLLQGASAPQASAALGVRAAKIDALVPSLSDLDVALTALADQHALTGATLHTALEEAQPTGPVPTVRGRHRWGWVAAAAIPLAVLGGYALTLDRDRDGILDDPTEGADTETGLAEGPTYYADAGWELDEDGDPPTGVMGLSLQEAVQLEPDEPEVPVSFQAESGSASFAVLWCDMPPADDPNLEVPSGTVTLDDGTAIAVPCAGRDGNPAVSQVVALPPRGSADVSLSGDLAAGDGATLGLYEEFGSTGGVPSPRGDGGDAPAPRTGAVVLDDSSALQGELFNQRLMTRTVEIGHDSSLEVWAGRTGAISVLVDGSYATDDGDVANWGAADQDTEWEGQLPDLRMGRWQIFTPDSRRAFDIPDDVRPPPGERRTAVVEVLTESTEESAQVQVMDAAPVDVDTSPVEQVATPDAPELVLGHRLLSQWDVPQDGHLRELAGEVDRDWEDLSIIAVSAHEGGLTGANTSLVTLDGAGNYLPVMPDMDAAATTLRGVPSGLVPPSLEPAEGAYTVAALLPATPGHTPGSVLVYAPVPYEDFDFGAAQVPPDAWPAGTDPPEGLGPDREAYLVLDQDDIEDGQVTASVEPTPGLTLRITTQGRGRMQFSLDGYPPQHQYADDGWWSSWTDEPVTSDLILGEISSSRTSTELTVDVEDYEDFTIEVLEQ